MLESLIDFVLVPLLPNSDPYFPVSIQSAFKQRQRQVKQFAVCLETKVCHQTLCSFEVMVVGQSFFEHSEADRYDFKAAVFVSLVEAMRLARE